jgi:hypothetical protein
MEMTIKKARYYVDRSEMGVKVVRRRSYVCLSRDAEWGDIVTPS